MTDANIIHIRCKRNDAVYRVVAYDHSTKVATLKGSLGGKITEPWDPARLKALGYEQVKGPFEGMIEV